MAQWWQNRTNGYLKHIKQKPHPKLRDTLRRSKTGRFKAPQASFVLVACESGVLSAAETYDSFSRAKRALERHCHDLNLDINDPHDERRDVWLVRICDGQFEEVSTWELC